MTPVLMSLNEVDSESLLSLPLGREYDERRKGALTFFADEPPICPR